MANLNYKHLRYFWAVAHDGNLTRAAGHMNLSQSALSVQIRKLEEQLGHDLFERRGRQLHLTEAGRIVLEYADTIMEAGRDMLSTLEQRGGPRQVLRVGALATLSRNFQIEFLRPLLMDNAVELVLRSGTPEELLGGLEALNLDVVLTNRVPATDTLSNFVAHPLAEQPVSLVGRPERCGADRDLRALLAHHPVILPTADNPLRAGFDRLCARLDIHPLVAAEVDDMAMMRLLARENAGLAVLPPIVVKNELDTGFLVEVDQLSGLQEAFYAVTISRRFPNPLLPALLENALLA